MLPDPPDPNVAAKHRGAEPGASVGIFLALLAAVVVFSHSSTPLLRYPDRAIGLGLLGGVDPARRFPIYLSLVAVALGVWLSCHYGVWLLQRKLPSWFSGVRSRLENDLCALFAALGSVALVARVAADRLDGLAPALLCLVVLGALLAVALLRRLCPRVSWFPRQLGSLSTLTLIVLSSWPASQICVVLGNLQGPDNAGWVLLGTVLLPLLYALALGYFLRRPGRARRSDVSRTFALAAAPFFLFPSLCPVANEIQHALAQRHEVEPRSVALGFLVLLTGVSAVLFWRAQRGTLRPTPRRLLSRCVYPAIIFGETLLSHYEHTLTISHFHPLHDGEQITAVHQLLQFDRWPFVDIWPAHGLFDYVGALYALVNGFFPLELTAWNGLLAALSATAVYALLANIATPLFAFAVAALLPIEAILPLPLYSFFYAEPGLLAVGLLASLVLTKPSLGRYALLSLATFLCFFWTPTSGVASILAVFGLLVLDVITTRDRRPVWRGLAVFLGTGAGVFAAYVLVLVLRGQPVLDTLRLIRAFMQADPLIGGRAEVLTQFDPPAFLQYVILPGIGLVYLARLARHAIERRPLDRLQRLLGFLTLVSFVLFARTLTRHSLIERFQPFYFPLLALCECMPRRKGALSSPLAASAVPNERRGWLAAHVWQRARGRAWFCTGLALYLAYFPEPYVKSFAFEPFSFHTWQAKESRTQGSVPSYPELSAFLAATLGPKQTFLELLNVPVLYGLLNREVPGEFFLPTMFYATDSVQNSYLARLEAFGGSARVPVVLTPADQGMNIDDIENTLRSYRISEHVYRNYVPFGMLDGFGVWVSRARWDEAAQAVRPRPLAFRDPSSYRTHSVKPPRLEAGVLELAATGRDPYVEEVVEVDDAPLGGLASAHAVRLSYRTSVAGKLELSYRFAAKYNAANSGVARLATSPDGEWQSTEVAIPPQLDPQVALKGLRIHPPDGAELEVKDLLLVFGEPPEPEPKRFVAGMLPFFWGNFDDHRAAELARVLENIDVPKDKQPLTSFDLKFRPIADKSSGNYLKLCVRLPGFESPRASSRWKRVQHAGSWDSAGKVTLSYGVAPSALFDFDLVQPTPGAPGLPDALRRSFTEECKPYLVRLSSQYVWSRQSVSSISVSSSVPIVIESASLLAGD